jgi:hypothetical protein
MCGGGWRPLLSSPCPPTHYWNLPTSFTWASSQEEEYNSFVSTTHKVILKLLLPALWHDGEVSLCVVVVVERT